MAKKENEVEREGGRKKVKGNEKEMKEGMKKE